MEDDDIGDDWGAALDEQATGESGDADEDLASSWGESLTEAGGDDGSMDDEVASEWASMIDNEPESEAKKQRTGDDRILNQDEIDNLLGFDGDDAFGNADTGIRAIIESAMVSYERLPMLEIIFDRLVRLMTTSLRNFTSDNVEVSLDNISSVRFGDYLDTIPLPAMLSVFKAREWDNYGLLTVDSALIYSVVDVLLGGRRGSPVVRVEGRPYTTIETNLIQRMVEVVLHDAEQAFAPLSPVKFNLERLETNPRFATIARSANAAILARFRIDMEDRGGRMEVLLPYATIEPIRDLLLQMFMGEKFGRDDIWEGHLATEMWSAEVEIRAVLDELELPVSRILNLQVGDTLLMNNGPEDPVTLTCGETRLSAGYMGRIKDHMAISVMRGLNRPKTTMAAFEAMDQKPQNSEAISS
ncbi:MAG: flagellar motor switch protein FliM [Pseudomonadota bacterium]